MAEELSCVLLLNIPRYSKGGGWGGGSNARMLGWGGGGGQPEPIHNNYAIHQLKHTLLSNLYPIRHSSAIAHLLI